MVYNLYKRTPSTFKRLWDDVKIYQEICSFPYNTHHNFIWHLIICCAYSGTSHISHYPDCFSPLWIKFSAVIKRVVELFKQSVNYTYGQKWMQNQSASILVSKYNQRGWVCPIHQTIIVEKALSLFFLFFIFLFHCYLPFSFSEFVHTQMRYFGKVFFI